MGNKIAASVFGADLGNLREQIQELERVGVDLLHVDVMDGHFVEKMAFGPDHIAALRRMTDLPLDVHLMVERPERVVDAIVAAGADLISVHVEATPRLLSCVERIKAAGCRAGIVLCPATSVTVVDDCLLDVTDMVLQMMINPGERGQSFHSGIVGKLGRIRERLGGRDIDLEVDGGIDSSNIRVVAEAGANVFVSGGYVFGGPIATRVRCLREALA